ncbi:MAG: S8 family serine peptidase [Firmicutes bacterium]|nr:S8 family serine peptidase [Candidatus Colivicinus equi]
MKNTRKILCLFINALLLITAISTKPIVAENNEINIGEYVEHEAIIITRDIDLVIKNNQTYELLGELEDGNIYLIRDEELSSEELILLLKENELVSDVEPNWIKGEETPEIEEEIDDTVALLVENISKEEEIADATRYQWSMNNDGRMLGTGKGIDMGYSDWNKTDTNLQEVVVAVIDCGVDYTQEDLNIWQDPGDIGLWHTYPNADKFGFNNCGGGDEETFYLERNHGTHCAGIIGALWNDKGISGVAPNAKIMSVRHDDCFSSFVACFEYVIAACKAGVPVKVTSNSWGTGSISSNILNKLVYELGEKYNVVSVFSAGNSYNDDDKTAENASALADNPYAIIVGAINPDGTISEFSCYGQNHVDIYAPGTMIISTDVKEFPYTENELNYYPEFDKDPVILQTFDKEKEYLTFNGLISSGAIEKHNMGYDDRNCLCIPSELIKKLPTESTASSSLLLSSDYVDLSSLEEKPQYLAFKFLPLKNGRMDFFLTSYHIPLVADDGTEYRYNGSFSIYQGSSATGWGSTYIDLTDFTGDWDIDQEKNWHVDWENFYLQISFDLQNDAYESVKDYDLYLDMFAMGNGLVPYVFMSGTSMACPAVAGEAAVIFGTYPNMKADEVVERILASVQKLPTCEGKCNSGGIANVDRALGKKLTPYIEEIKILSNNKIQISGSFFRKILDVEYKPEDDNSFTKIQYKQRDDGSVIAYLPKDFVGGNAIIKIANEYGYSPTKNFKLGNNSNYEYFDTNEVKIPEEIKEVLGTYDGCSLTAYNNHIYFLQQVSDVPAKYQGELDSIPDKMVRYGINDGKWEVIKLPIDLINKAGIKNIRYYSATAYKEKLYVLIASSSVEEHLGCMLTLDEHDKWKIDKKYNVEIPADNFTLANINDELYLVGATNSKILKWDEESKSFITYGGTERMSPNVAVYGKDIWVSGGTVPGLAGETVSSVERLVCTIEDEEFGPRYSSKEEYKFEEFVEQMKDMYYGIAAVQGGIIVVGPTSKDNKSDTYFIPIDENGNPQEAISLNIRASNSPLLRPAAIGYKDKLYVYSYTSSNDMTMSATYIETNEFPGDVIHHEHHEKDYRPVATSVE